MKVCIEWLNEHLDRPIEAPQLGELLANQGFPIEEADADAGVLDIEVTSNRGDCLSHVGVAREVAAGSGRVLRFDVKPAAPDAAASPGAVQVENQAPDLCPLYTARLIRDVKVGPSPPWMVRRLEAVGLRSVNNVVDVTNYVLFELGQPLHAFDFDRLDAGRIVVRRAREGEAFAAINGSRHTLGPDMLVIADGQRPVAVAGVMGGLDCEVGPATRNILLESAIFEPLTVRSASRALKLASDSSYRFERGVDPAGVDPASRRAAALICELAGAAESEGVGRAGSASTEPRNVEMRVARCRSLMGIDIDAAAMVAALEGLGLCPRIDAAGARITCAVPSFRLDLHREVDLIEEVARTHGLEKIPVQERISIVAQRVPPLVAARQVLGQVMTAHGYHETVTPSFVQLRQGTSFLAGGHEPVCVDESRRSGARAEPMLRPSLLPSLLVCRKANQDVGNSGLRLFEVASTWSRVGDRIEETQRLAMLADVAGGADAGQIAICDVRGTLEELVGRLMGHGRMDLAPCSRPSMQLAATACVAGRDIGMVGMPDAGVLATFDVHAQVVVAELEVEPLLRAYPPSSLVKRLARFPAVERDLSIIVQDSVSWEKIERAVRDAEPAMLERLQFVVVYRGKQVASGHKSVTLRMVFRAADTTLRHDQVDGEVAKVVEKLKDQLGSQLRDGQT
jgi:phenylalanyl-tRNA synthetase beta chain